MPHPHIPLQGVFFCLELGAFRSLEGSVEACAVSTPSSLCSCIHHPLPCFISERPDPPRENANGWILNGLSVLLQQTQGSQSRLREQWLALFFQVFLWSLCQHGNPSGRLSRSGPSPHQPCRNVFAQDGGNKTSENSIILPLGRLDSFLTLGTWASGNFNGEMRTSGH